MGIFYLLLVVTVVKQTQRLDDGDGDQDRENHYPGLRSVRGCSVGQEVFELAKVLSIEVLDKPCDSSRLANVGLY